MKCGTVYRNRQQKLCLQCCDVSKTILVLLDRFVSSPVFRAVHANPFAAVPLFYIKKS